MTRLGKCPACGVELQDNDVEDTVFRGGARRHVSYRCRKCDTVIGFSSYNLLM